MKKGKLKTDLEVKQDTDFKDKEVNVNTEIKHDFDHKIKPKSVSDNLPTGNKANTNNSKSMQKSNLKKDYEHKSSGAKKSVSFSKSCVEGKKCLSSSDKKEELSSANLVSNSHSPTSSSDLTSTEDESKKKAVDSSNHHCASDSTVMIDTKLSESKIPSHKHDNIQSVTDKSDSALSKTKNNISSLKSKVNAELFNDKKSLNSETFKSKQNNKSRSHIRKRENSPDEESDEFEEPPNFSPKPAKISKLEKSSIDSSVIKTNSSAQVLIPMDISGEYMFASPG